MLESEYLVAWANNENFPPKTDPAGNKEIPGFDAIIGQVNGNSRSITGVDPKAQNASLALPTEWVVPKGGEYFFSPSIPALKNTFAMA